MGIANPFDELAEGMAEMRNVLSLCCQHFVTLRTEVAAMRAEAGAQVARIDRLVQAVSEPAPLWEDLPTACATRGKAKRSLVQAAKSGVLRFQRVTGRGGKDKWLLSVEDLDRHFPALGKKKADGHNSAGSLNPFGLRLAAPATSPQHQ